MTTRKLTVALLAGGKSAEREVSLKSGEQVYRALNKDRYDIRRYDPRDDLLRLAQDAKTIDVALIILHGRLGEDHHSGFPRTSWYSVPRQQGTGKCRGHEQDPQQAVVCRR